MSTIAATTGDPGPRTRRLCISVDLEAYSRWDADDQRQALTDLSSVLEETCHDAGLDRTVWALQPAGDGELAVLPAGIDEGAAISQFVRALAVVLHRHNHSRGENAILRLRIAMHAGLTQATAMGYTGAAPIVAARLRDCDQARESLAADDGANFALVISQQLYEDHVAHDYPDFGRGTFRRIRVEIPAKDFLADAWLYAVEHAKPASNSPVPGRGADQPSGGVVITGGTVQAGTIAGRDIITGSRS